MSALRLAVVAAGLLLVWALIVRLSGVPPYILPGPELVLDAWTSHVPALARHGAVTFTEILLGLLAGTALGVVSALSVAGFRGARRWVLPVLVASQAIPVFALAPLLVLWLGYGMPSKVAMATLIIYFPVTVAFLDGLNRTDPAWLDLARTMTAGRGRAGRRAILWHVRVPAALPALASGLRVATAVAPIGAVVGEWVGSSAGLGYLMLHANGRMQIDLMFAALLTLAALSVLLYFTVDRLLRRLLPWQPERAFDRAA
ncbi:ABC transporter permease [Oceanibacterium hippocampi]|uniref:Putative aliphatic sulfonates transport permease protein SsuC n=1 Tax=Oceanibacterium hippocampi TaxID=745714 RepID=A0A1Y5U4C3_9PROT|nr:ABC transporter permease [Oceanibacterium hippocampi]SLN76957.1 Putative aliphatic sulfonates transport permease protein SsuC [Oceanibacterium hippocampi]